ncbi:MAG: hypothetical protein AAFU67_17495 [Bacteroidota bacterium]
MDDFKVASRDRKGSSIVKLTAATKGNNGASYQYQPTYQDLAVH